MTGNSVALLLRRAVRAGLVPGAVAAWGTPEHLEFAAVGRARVLGTREDASLDTWYDLASLTKPLATTTLLLLALRESGAELATPVAEVLPETRGRWLGGLPLWRLATHTAGLPAWVPLYALSRGRRGLLLEALLAIEPEVPPGTDVIYSCPGFVLLGLVVERLGGDGVLADLFRERVAVPLGLARGISFASARPGGVSMAGGARTPRAELEQMAALRAAGWTFPEVPPPPGELPDDGNARFLGGSAGNSGLVGTAEAVARLAFEYLPGGGVLLRSHEVELATRCWTEGMSQARGLGWQLARTPGCSAGPAVPGDGFGHTGFTGTSVWVEPRTRWVMVLLTNRHHPAHRGADLHPLRRRFHTLVLSSAQSKGG